MPDERLAYETKEQFPPGMQQRWLRMDTNGDGFVDLDEPSVIIQRFRRFSDGEAERP